MFQAGSAYSTHSSPPPIPSRTRCQGRRSYELDNRVQLSLRCWARALSGADEKVHEWARVLSNPLGGRLVGDGIVGGASGG
jgi:hypothetical protein